jgi:hypothetical protein
LRLDDILLLIVGSVQRTIQTEAEAYAVDVRLCVAARVVLDAPAVSANDKHVRVEVVADAEDSLGLGVALHREHA